MMVYFKGLCNDMGNGYDTLNKNTRLKVIWEKKSYIDKKRKKHQSWSNLFLSLASDHMKTERKMVTIYKGFPGGTSGKEPACQCRRHKRCRFDPWIGKIPWRRVWQPTPGFLPGESRGQRSLEGWSPWVCRIRHDWATCHAVLQGIFPTQALNQSLTH